MDLCGDTWNMMGLKVIMQLGSGWEEKEILCISQVGFVIRFKIMDFVTNSVPDFAQSGEILPNSLMGNEKINKR